MAEIRRTITVSVVEDIEHEAVGVEVNVPDTMTTLEAIGLLEIAKNQHFASKHTQGPTIYQTPDAGEPETP